MEQFAPRRILIATDFSDLSTWALRHAVLWAQRFRADLIVLYAQEFPPIEGNPHFGSYNLAGMMKAYREAAMHQMEECVRQCVPANVPVSCQLSGSPPPRAIEGHAADGQADLVVLGTHGRGGLSRLLLGSVAERTLRMARHPTLIVRQSHAQPASQTEVPQLKHVLCPVNDTAVARASFEHACSVARTFAACLTVVFVVEPIHGDPTPEYLRAAEERLRSWLPAQPGVEYQLQPVVHHGNAAEQIVTLAGNADVDLVVIGAQHRRFADTTVLGVTTVRVTRHAPCPVLVVPWWSDAQPS